MPNPLSSIRGRLLVLVLFAVLPALGMIVELGARVKAKEHEAVKSNLVAFARILAQDQSEVVDGSRALLAVWLHEHARASRLLPGSTVTVVDRRGIVLARYPEAPEWIGRDLRASALVRAILAQREGVIEAADVDHDRQLYAYAPLGPDDAGAFVAVGVPTTLAFAAANRLIHWHLFAFTTVALLVIAAAWIGGHVLIVRRLRRLLGAVRSIGAGNLDIRATQNGGADEVAELTAAFDEMAAALGRRDAEAAATREAVEQSEERYRRMFEHSPRPMWVHDERTGEILGVNRAALTTYGFEESEVLAMRITDLDVQAGETAPSGSGERRHRRKDGSVMDVEVVSDAIFFGGRALRLVTAVDITDRKRTEAALRRQATEAALAADVTRALASDAAPGRILSDCAAALVRHLDVALARVWTTSVDGRTLELAGSAGLSTDLDGADRRVRVGERAIGRIAERREPDASDDATSDPDVAALEWVQAEGLTGFAGYPLLVGDRLVGVLGVFRRVPLTGATLELVAAVARELAQAVERKRAEAALADSEEQIRQLQRLEAVGRLAGGVAHDFNNLLTVINGRARLAFDRLPGEHPVKRDLGLIVETADRAAALTRQLLAFSRKQILEPKVIDLNTLVPGMTKLLQRLLGEDVELVFHPGRELGRVKADPGQIEQVVINLAVNARDAMPMGGRLTVQTANASLDWRADEEGFVEPGPYVLLSVVDTGTGMTPEVKRRIFEPFFTTKPQGKGTGLGLSTVYGIVKQSGGHIEVESEPAQGATFRIYLPRLADAPGRDEAAPAVVAPRGHETILLVEDEKEVGALASDMLQSVGYTILLADSPEAALALARRHAGTIDLLLADVVMPHMSGRVLAEELTAMRPGLRVLYMSGYTDDAIVHHGVLTQGTPFIHKPFTLTALAVKVRDTLDRSVAPA